jgi:hypothetical protein
VPSLDVPVGLVEPEGGDVVLADVQPDGSLAGAAGKVFCGLQQGVRHAVPAVHGRDDETLDVRLGGGGRVARVGEEGGGPGGAREAQVAPQGLPQTAREGVVFRGTRAHSDARGDLRVGVVLDNERTHPAQRVLQPHPLVHYRHRTIHPATEDRAKLVQKSLDDEAGDVGLVPRRRVTNGICLFEHPAIVAFSAAGAVIRPAETS